MSVPILETKLYIPALRTELVSRPRLLERLNEGIRPDCKLVLVSAPVGFGKTTLVSEWVHHVDVPTAWLSLDEGDNDPNRFWSHLVAALQNVHPGVGKVIPAISQSQQFSSVEPLLTDLVNEMAALAGPSVLILDDLHVIDERQIHCGLVFLVENLPPQMCVVVSSRADPPWPLAGMRARGNLIELRSGDMRFHLDEVTAFIKVTRLELSEEAITTLGERTEGWIAGLQMAALSMRGQNVEQTATFLRTFGGSHRFILDYLVEEMLSRQPAPIQDFLLKTSILDRLTASLCATVMGSSDQDSQSVLTRIERANLFLVPLDDERRWYRYHHLFADLLRSRLQQTLPDQVPALHLKASRWYEKNGVITEAVRHALDAGDTERVVHLIAHNVLAMAEGGAIRSVVRWLDALPDDFVYDRPWLGVARAWTLANTGRFDLVEPLLHAAETAVMSQDERQHLTGHAAVVRAYVALSSGDLDRAAQSARQALAHLSGENAMLCGYLYSLLNMTQVCRGDLDAASRASSEALALCRSDGDIRIMTSVLCDCAALQVARGRFHEAAILCREALSQADQYLRQSGRPLLVAGRAHQLLSGVLYEFNELSEAVHHAQEGVTLCKRWGQPDFLADAYCRLARVSYATGDVQGAMEAIQAARKVASQVPSLHDTNVAAREAHLHLAQGDTLQAIRWARQSGLGVDDELGFARIFEYESLVRVYVSQGQGNPRCLDDAMRLLARLLENVEQAGAIYYIVRLLVLQATALAQHETDRALVALARALDMAEAEGYIRVFVDQGEPINGLLGQILARRLSSRQTAHRDVTPGYVNRLLSALREEPGGVPPRTIASQSSALVEPLSERECEVLRLVAAGLSNREIAQTLVIALNTVKNHLKNVYGKLAVHSRTQAVERARSLDLL